MSDKCPKCGAEFRSRGKGGSIPADKNTERGPRFPINHYACGASFKDDGSSWMDSSTCLHRQLARTNELAVAGMTDKQVRAAHPVLASRLEDLRRQLARLKAETELEQRPTAWAYEQVCEVLRATNDALAQANAKLDKLRSVAGKLRLCFPDEMADDDDDQEFIIPAYVVVELDVALKAAEAAKTGDG